ncbi:MAG: hypothetical protein A3C30_01280 [Candidatus Levybacteria bacterium RIFCSPHIGHO2_02_FULL_40_18]|nr:MAG: hypothetical protein A2869_00845 [Candidatus Levybacteria bacterium RIFCSPHIGHO2_01_FULL_40_58]OGH26634.1 MAG: hypothetical protein A3C30_01280 [Candidatus Levybacteria bacterium RIFCSPHIGHO2_02_FULL_40_18]OGH31163.1 MAG: hypothetical protein A3E43_00115 [Candidatus Levybacteria bacterium RIFCSPHIGHO2_12_FULL_40_31]OGH39845.1 MAG: hypothetical protein A2894_03620 [Candidatus Levybacteria bacterium RIFCSPLOWO2_01_FULL_40_64]OGH48869.1 MAG: hypothetical protein A3I54_04725 [Candidatus Lev
MDKKNPIAYFCAEYALTSELPIYAGGLGVLAGDYLKEADDQRLPVVGVGLYYNDGYETLHEVGLKGNIQAPHVHTPPQDYGLSPLLDENQSPILIDVPIKDKNIKVKAWKWNVGTIPVYLMDTNVPQNSEEDKKITDHLYVVDNETRFCQAIVLGVGGVRLLERLGINPSIYHMNEGFSSLLCFELIKNEMKNQKIGFEDAARRISRKVVYTNHTLVTRGHDVFSSELASVCLSKYAQELGIGMDEIIKLGVPAGSSSFSKSLFALRMAGKTNAVSGLHAQKSAEVFPHYPMQAITNGIHVPSWNKIQNDNDFWAAHCANKNELLKEVNQLTDFSFDDRALLVGWARRLVPYKRPNALLEDIDRLKKILENSDHPVRIVISGTQHPSDIEAKQFLEDIRNTIDSKLKGLAAFLPGYNLSFAKLLVSGCDIWLNTPMVGMEACGTSGMKAALNGDLPVSTRDGWMQEVDFYGIGWPLDSDKINESILASLENEIIPLYFDRDEKDVPKLWIENMIRARHLIKDRFSTARMIKDYIEQLYLPLLSL